MLRLFPEEATEYRPYVQSLALQSEGQCPAFKGSAFQGPVFWWRGTGAGKDLTVLMGAPEEQWVPVLQGKKAETIQAHRIGHLHAGVVLSMNSVFLQLNMHAFVHKVS